MAKVYFVREEISIEIPVGTSVLEAGDSGGACAGCALAEGREHVGNVW